PLTPRLPPTPTLFPYTTLFRSSEPHRSLTCAAHIQAHENAVSPSSGNGEAMVQLVITSTRIPRSQSRAPVPRWLRGMAVPAMTRSEEHTLNSSHEWISYAVFCL